MTKEKMLRNLEKVYALYKDRPVHTFEINIASMVKDIISFINENTIEAEPKDDWIPVSEPPKENGKYIVSLEDAVDTSARFFNGKWFMSPVDSIAREYGKYEVTAWRPLPEPYKESDE